jgi:hypothetical protein
VGLNHVVAKGFKRSYYLILVDMMPFNDEPIVAGCLVAEGAYAQDIAPQPEYGFR